MRGRHAVIPNSAGQECVRGPALRQPQNGARRQAGGLGAEEGGQRFAEVPRRQPVQVEQRQDALHARRPPHVGRQDHARELLPDPVVHPPVVDPGGGDGQGADARGHRARARRAVAHDQGVAALVARLTEARHVLRGLQLQRRRDHPPRSVARQIIQRLAHRRRLIRVRPRGDNLQHGWRTFPPVATGALGFDCSTSPEGYVAFLSHPQLLTIAQAFEGKTPLITGGNSGIGLATAKEFVNEGAYVFITGRRDPELAAAVKEIGRNVSRLQGDVANLGDLDRLFAQITREKGSLDIVFANAGVAEYAALGSITEKRFDSIFDINVKGLLFTVQKALPLMPDGASIILNASIVASKGLPANSVYSATKAAVRSFARTWTTDLKDRRIRVNAVSPGPIDTPGLSDLLASSETGQQRRAMISNMVPLGRFGTPDEIAKAVVFLASDDSSYITGTELFVDGGFAQV